MAFIEGLGILIFGLSQNLVLDLLAFYLFGAGMAGFFATVVTLLQQETEESVRGRIFSLYGVFAVSLMPVGYLLAGNLAKITTTSFVLSLAGVIILLTAFWLFLTGMENGSRSDWLCQRGRPLLLSCLNVLHILLSPIEHLDDNWS